MSSWEIVSAAIRAAASGKNDFVLAVETVLATESWRSYVTPTGEEFQHASFKHFVEAKPNAGLGLSVQTFVGLLEDTNVPEVAQRVRVAVLDGLPEANPNGTNRFSLSGTKATSGQPDSGYVVSRLKRDDPQLAAQVVEGKLTPNAAAVKAGIRHKYARIRTDDPQRAVAKLLEHYDRDTIIKAIGGAS
jgi:hypothetical protein